MIEQEEGRIEGYAQRRLLLLEIGAQGYGLEGVLGIFEHRVVRNFENGIPTESPIGSRIYVLHRSLDSSMVLDEDVAGLARYRKVCY